MENNENIRYTIVFKTGIEFILPKEYNFAVCGLGRKDGLNAYTTEQMAPYTGLVINSDEILYITSQAINYTG